MRGAPQSGLARLISRISRRISGGTLGLPARRRDFQRQKPAHRAFITRFGPSRQADGICDSDSVRLPCDEGVDSIFVGAGL